MPAEFITHECDIRCTSWESTRVLVIRTNHWRCAESPFHAPTAGPGKQVPAYLHKHPFLPQICVLLHLRIPAGGHGLSPGRPLQEVKPTHPVPGGFHRTPPTFFGPSFLNGTTCCMLSAFKQLISESPACWRTPQPRLEPLIPEQQHNAERPHHNFLILPLLCSS